MEDEPVVALCPSRISALPFARGLVRLNLLLLKMNSESTPTRVLYENLDTSFVNLWGLLRFLSQKSFIGRVHVELADYSADVFLSGSDAPLVHEIDRAAGTDVVEEAALHRLVLRVREAPGTITVYEGADEAVAPETEAAADETDSAATPESMRSSGAKDLATETKRAPSPEPASATIADWSETSRLSGELIAAVERAAVSMGADFDSLFHEARVALADDYSFLDPLSGSLRYAESTVTINGESAPAGYVAGISEVLRRVVDQFATGERERRTRERIAVELARVARKNGDAMARSEFREQLDRIAGTKVI